MPDDVPNQPLQPETVLPPLPEEPQPAPGEIQIPNYQAGHVMPSVTPESPADSATLVSSILEPDPASLQSGLPSGQVDNPPPPAFPKSKGKFGVVLAILLLLLISVPVGVYVLSLRTPRVADIRNIAAIPYPTLDPNECTKNGFSCFPNSAECTREGGSLVNLNCASGVCCNFPTDTPTPPLHPTPTCTMVWHCGVPDAINPNLCKPPIYEENQPACQPIGCPVGQCVYDIPNDCHCPGGGGATNTPRPGGNTNTPTRPPPTRTPTRPQTSTTPPVGVCKNIKIYLDGVQITTGQVHAGETIQLAVSGTGSPTRARFRVTVDGQAGPWLVTTTLNAKGEYVLNYTVPAGVHSLFIEAEVYDHGVWV